MSNNFKAFEEWQFVTDLVASLQGSPHHFLSQKITSENLSIYRSSFDFIKQGFYNGVEYVDGFMYFDIYIPSTIQDSLGLQFDFQFP